jgi:hypothetical protein
VRRTVLFLALLTMGLACAPAGAQESCDELMRGIKLNVFDREWGQVETSAGRLLAEFPECRHRQQASYLLAQALDRGGQPERALVAYAGFLEDYCRGETEAIDCGLAQVALYDLAGRQYERTGGKDYLEVLTDGLNRSGDAGIFAALRLSDMKDHGLRARALPRLLKAYDTDIDPDVRNRVYLAILKIDPKRAPSEKTDGSDGADDGPSLISVEVFSKEANRVEVRVNMPVILADALVKALPDAVRQEMAKDGIDIEMIYKAIREQNHGTIFEAETPEITIRIWLQ